MDEYPPLPASKAVNASLQNLDLSDGEASGSGSPVPVAKSNGRGSSSQSSTKRLVRNGDIILVYEASKHAPGTASRWILSSESLMKSSPYFRALLDPDKFYEGRNLMSQRKLHSLNVDSKGDTVAPGYSVPPDALPTIRLTGNHLPPHLGLDAIELFLKVLSFGSFSEEEKSSFDAEVKAQRPSSIASLIELADAFNSPQAVHEALTRSRYTPGKPKLPLTKFDSAILKLNEDRIRQSIFIAKFLNNRALFKILTHALIVTGSRHWTNGIPSPEPESPCWHYFHGGLEEELYYRRQCVLNTITDLQAYFLRLYGALDPTAPSSTAPRPNHPQTQTQTQTQYQCRCGLGNSSACDTFHLGQMTRFFALRTKTIFLGSTLLDPDFDPDMDSASALEFTNNNLQTRPPPHITSIIATLKQCPDYQIDSNHTACGIRRRFLPSLDCIEGFVGDERGLLGVSLDHWRNDDRGEGGGGGGGGSGLEWPHIYGSWANRSLPRALVIDLRLARISGIPAMSRGVSRVNVKTREEDARLLFTAKRRNWEA
ncbi:hypothetical protein BJX61DRAFT_403897 [Aspergillus egyptiacus]|nr:hypothetical protein BJX61DRAFT_403897 [Aspergillus egyptiacus]